MKKILTFIATTAMMVAYQNCGDGGFVPLDASSFTNVDLTSTTPGDDEPITVIPKTLDELLANRAFTFTDAENFYTIDHIYDSAQGLQLSGYLSALNAQNQEIVTEYRQIQMNETGQQVGITSAAFSLPQNHEYIDSAQGATGANSVLTLIDNVVALTWHLNIYNGPTLACTTEITGIGSMLRQALLRSGTTTVFFTHTLVGNLNRVDMHGFDDACNEIFRVQLSAEDARDLVFADAEIANNLIYVSKFSVTADANGDVVRQPIVSTFDLNGVLQNSMAYDTPGQLPSAVQMHVGAGGEVYMAGVIRQNQFASRNMYHFKVNADLVASNGYTAGYGSDESVGGIFSVGGEVWVFGTMENPASELESVFYYRLNGADMSVTKQVIIDTANSDIFVNVAFVRSRFFAISMNVGDDSTVLFVDDSVSGAPIIEGFNTFTDNLLFSTQQVTSLVYNLVVQ